MQCTVEDSNCLWYSEATPELEYGRDHSQNPASQEAKWKRATSWMTATAVPFKRRCARADAIFSFKFSLLFPPSRQECCCQYLEYEFPMLQWNKSLDSLKASTGQSWWYYSSHSKYLVAVNHTTVWIFLSWQNVIMGVTVSRATFKKCSGVPEGIVRSVYFSLIKAEKEIISEVW